MRAPCLRTGLLISVPWRASEDVEHATTVRATAPPGNPARQLAVIDLQLHDRIQRLTQLGQHVIQRASLRQVARKPVENEATLGIGLRQALTNHTEHDFVLDQAAGVHGLLGLEAELGTVGNRSAQQVPRGDLGDAMALDETLRLRALAGAGRSQ